MRFFNTPQRRLGRFLKVSKNKMTPLTRIIALRVESRTVSYFLSLLLPENTHKFPQHVPGTDQVGTRRMRKISCFFCHWFVIAFSFEVMLLCIPSGSSEAQLTSNVLRRVRLIRPTNSKTHGTAFTLEVDKRQYLITAKHVVAGLKAEDTLQIYKAKKWKTLKVKVLRCDNPIDIAVLIPPTQLTVTFALEPTMKGIQFGQDVYFAGFPYGLFTDGWQSPIPFMKKAILSASFKRDGVIRIYLDGHNNPGFSGGPIVYRDLRNKGTFTFRLAGVVSGFRRDFNPVLQPEKIKEEEIKPEDRAKNRIIQKDGQLLRLNDTEQMVQINTGIVVGYSISHALDLIHKNPIGPMVSDEFKGW